jgi:hypothetical protein
VPYEEKIIERYRAVCALEERGATEGERNAAAAQRQKLDEKYPGIRQEAFPPPPPQDDGFDPFRSWRTQQPEQEEEAPRGRRGGGWGDFFGGGGGSGGQRRWQETASDVLGWAAKVAQEMSSLGTARAYAESITELNTKMLQSEKWQISVRFPLRDLYAVSANMNEAQRQEFARYVASMVEAEVLAALSEGGS